jgi:hypothetical protein
LFYLIPPLLQLLRQFYCTACKSQTWPNETDSVVEPKIFISVPELHGAANPNCGSSFGPSSG